ncbi:Fatty acid desaturase domain [Trinorchestia longiramus]|nr:Fatty acid desaturase domain [Trinorchestia longiramus]
MAPHETGANLPPVAGIPSEQGRRNPTPGFQVDVPTDRNIILKTGDSWMNGKRIDDRIGKLWRIHDKLYDLAGFMDKHPGGRFWIETTRGTDITEAFESAHVNPAVAQLLPKYYVRDATTKRNSPYTFHENGFYKTLQRKAWQVLSKVGSGPSLQMRLMMDGQVALFIALVITAATHQSYVVAFCAGLVLWTVMGTAHNFFHQRDNFRMLYFDLSPLSSSEWRITHALSHHLYTNTVYDFEISVLEPFIHFLPEPHKHVIHKYTTPITCHLTMMLAFVIEITKKFAGLCTRSRKFEWPNIMPWIQCALMVVLTGSLRTGLGLYLTMTCTASFFFAWVGLIAAHHHPDIYHAYDTFRSSPDWGLCQLDAVRDKVEATGSLFLVAISFGDHTLHHLFPTVDHSKLPHLYPAFLEVCKKFDVNFSFMTQKNLMWGMYTQLCSSHPNPNPPRYTETKPLLPKIVENMIK